MSYPGNPSLAEDVRARILTTFRQSVEAAARGNRQEALLGSDFILRLDADFELARTLQQMLAAGEPAASYRALLEGLPVGRTPPPPAPQLASLAGSSPGLVASFARLLEARRFGDLLSAAQAQAAAVAGDPKVRELVETAQSRYEAEPFVRELLDHARRALGSGHLDEIDGLLEKARSLDPTHPGLAEIDRLRSSASASAAQGLQIDWEDEAPPPTLVAPPVSDLAATTRSTRPAPATFAPQAPAPPPAPFPKPPAEPTTNPSFEPATPLPSDLDLPDIDFSLGELPTFDDAGEAPVGLDDAPAPAGSDSGTRVQALLDEGQGAFDRGEYQSAIDSWSRIFLIDIDNQESAQRIERARQLKAEQEREVEEVFHAGVARFDAGDWAGAREAFRKVLDEQPSYVLAREYLDKIDEREAAGGAPQGLPELAPLPRAPTAPPEELAAASRVARPSTEEILIPPDPGIQREARKPAVGGFAIKAKRGSLPSPRFLAIGGGVLALLLVGGWYLRSNWSRLFPNATPPAPQTTAVDPIDQAKKLQASGKTAVAIAALRRIPPQEGAYGEAQSLISQWEKLAAPAAAPSIPIAQRLEREKLLASARSAAQSGDHYLASQHLDEAAAIAPLDGDWSDLRANVDHDLAGVSEELGLMRDGDYERALNRLWRRHEADPADKDVRHLMVDAYYDLSLSDLRRGDPRAARAKLRDALELDPRDPMLARMEHFCATYEQRGQDLLYRIYVKYLPTR